MQQYNFLNSASTGPFQIQMGVFLPIFLLLVIWSIVWKGLALWRAAKNSHTGWFVALLLINTLGILEIIYLYTVGSDARSNRGRSSD